mmetsp:Transcript_120678/g.346755  ORF Transcript_120678/g.346755 Transcript_120678/m.346755 type:complete len:82 (-) Transcript_120678:247-492(-)
MGQGFQGRCQGGGQRFELSIDRECHLIGSFSLHIGILGCQMGLTRKELIHLIFDLIQGLFQLFLKGSNSHEGCFQLFLFQQ